MASTKPILGVPSTMNDSYQLNIRKLFERGCLLQPSSEIVTLLKDGTTDRIKYIDAQRRATKIASLLQNNYNLNIGDRVGTFMWSNNRHMLLLYAVPCIGAILNPINFRLHPKDLSFILNHTKHKMMFIDQDLIPYFNKIPSQSLQSIKYFVICAENGLPTNTNYKSLLTNINHTYQKVIDFRQFENQISPNNFTWPNLDERNGATLLYTSGTTGNPKGSLYGHRSLYIHLLNAATTDVFGASGTDCMLPFPQLFHVLGGLMPLLGFMLGCKILLLGNCNDYNKILDFCLTEQCTVILGVPTVVQAFRNAMKSNPNKYAPMKGVLTRVICGGSSPPPDLTKWFWDNYQIELIQGWGMSETQGVAYVSRRCARRSDLLLSENERGQNALVPGIPLPSIHGKIVNENENTNEKRGVFFVNGPIATTRYYAMSTPDKFDKNGWLNTGDIVSYTDKQQIVIHDRSKDMIKSGGEWISSQDMETYIAARFANQIDKVCVVGVKHELYQERPIVVIQLLDDKSISKQEIIKYLSKKYANFQLPDDILFWNEIPLTGTDKISKKDVRLKLQKQDYKLPKIPLRKRIENVLKSKL